MVMSTAQQQHGLVFHATTKIQNRLNMPRSSQRGIYVLSVIRRKERSGRQKSIGMGLLQQGNAVYAITRTLRIIFHGLKNLHGICVLHATKTGHRAGMWLQDLCSGLRILQRAGRIPCDPERSFLVQAAITPMLLIRGRFLPMIPSVRAACAKCVIKNR